MEKVIKLHLRDLESALALPDEDQSRAGIDKTLQCLQTVDISIGPYTIDKTRQHDNTNMLPHSLLELLRSTKVAIKLKGFRGRMDKETSQRAKRIIDSWKLLVKAQIQQPSEPAKQPKVPPTKKQKPATKHATPPPLAKPQAVKSAPAPNVSSKRVPVHLCGHPIKPKLPVSPTKSTSAPKKRERFLQLPPTLPSKKPKPTRCSSGPPIVTATLSSSHSPTHPSY